MYIHVLSESNEFLWTSRDLNGNQVQLITIFNGCEVQIDNFVARVTVRHHKACRVIPNGYPD